MKLYILLPEKLLPGQIAAQTAHAATKAQALLQHNYKFKIWQLPVVCLYHHGKQHLTEMCEDFPDYSYVIWSEPDYGFECVSAAVLVEDKAVFKNRLFGKLKLV